jgi:hypothetical protein
LPTPGRSGKPSEFNCCCCCLPPAAAAALLLLPAPCAVLLLVVVLLLLLAESLYWLMSSVRGKRQQQGTMKVNLACDDSDSAHKNVLSACPYEV